MAWWQAQKIHGVLIGGLAVALLGRPRVTRDVDAMVLLAEELWPACIESAGTFGFLPRLPDALAFAHQARVLLLRQQPTGIDIDIAFGCLPFEQETVARATHVQIAGTTVPLPSPEDLVIMKAVAHRERDLQDIEGLLIAYPDLDTRRVRHWVRSFADAMEQPELYDDLVPRLPTTSKKGRGKGTT